MFIGNNVVNKYFYETIINASNIKIKPNSALVKAYKLV